MSELKEDNTVSPLCDIVHLNGTSLSIHTLEESEEDHVPTDCLDHFGGYAAFFGDVRPAGCLFTDLVDDLSGVFDIVPGGAF